MLHVVLHCLFFVKWASVVEVLLFTMQDSLQRPKFGVNRKG